MYYTNYRLSSLFVLQFLIAKIAIITHEMQQAPMMLNATISKGEKVPEIESLTTEVGRLSTSVDSWNTAIIVMMIVAALAATGLVLTQYIAFRKAKTLNDVQTRLARLKESQVERNLKDEELKIEELRSQSASLLRQLMAQGPRSYLLYGEARDKFIGALSPFPTQKVEIRYCDTSFNQFPLDKDVIDVIGLLTGIFRAAKWSAFPMVRENCGGSGISVAIDPKASASTKKASDALLSALLALPLAVVGNQVFVTESPRNLPQPIMFDAGKQVILPPLRDTIVVTVLPHP
jgi:hypothetical protein